MRKLNRREFISSSTAMTILALLPPSLQAAIATANPPLSEYGASSTAEEVTAGLDLSGKTYAITGANSGLGFETMRVLSLRGAHVLAIARTLQKAENACAQIDGDTTPYFCDLADLASVANAGQAIRKSGVTIDGLICNAGVMALPELAQVNGIERQFAINHLGHFVLINQLMNQVAAAEQGRFVILSSLAHRRAPEVGIEFDNLSGERDYTPWGAYGHSKLANALCSLELARRLQGTTATSNSVHPGVINTNLGRNLPWWQRVMGTLIGWTFMKSVEEGAATTSYVATSPGLEKVSGHYFADCNPADGTDHLRDEDMAAKLWAVSEDLTRDYLPTLSSVAATAPTLP